MTKKYNVISIGSSIRDIFIKNRDLKYSKNDVGRSPNIELLGGKINIKRMYFDVGGGASNSAATFANLGLKVAILSCVGNDLADKEIIRVMKKFKVDTNLIKTDFTNETGYSVIFLDKDGDKTALIYRGAADFKTIKKIPTHKMKADWFFITSLNGNYNLLKKIFTLARKNNTRIAWNPGQIELNFNKNKIVSLLKYVDSLFLNLNEAKKLTGSKTKKIKIIFKKLNSIAPNAIKCITGGKKGAWVKKNQQFYQTNILDKKVINTTGAGDAFGSGFVAGLIIYNYDIKKALQLAMLNSNSVVTKMGAKHGLLKKLPTKKMLGKIKIKQIK